MRIIKFRQWSSGSFHYWGHGVDCFTGPLSNRLDIPSEQFTGLLDKNGKEIYEGDIVHVIDGDERDDVCDTGIGTVVFLENAGLWYIDGKINNGLFDIYQEHYIEIIGNIHENMELITK